MQYIHIYSPETAAQPFLSFMHSFFMAGTKERD